MAKINYYEALEELSQLAAEAVRHGAEGGLSGLVEAQSDLRRRCDRKICELENALFADFMPPLERDNIAACAHAFSRVIDKANDLAAASVGAWGVANKWNREGAVCVKLSEELVRHTELLRTIRKPKELPDLKGFRSLLAEGRRADAELVRRVNSGALPKSCMRVIILTARLSSELSRAFDEIVEIMLNNI